MWKTILAMVGIMSHTRKLNSHEQSALYAWFWKFKSIRTYSRHWRNLVYMYLCCAQPALRASNVPILKVSQHYLLTECGEIKVYCTPIWAYSATTRRIFCCVPKHERCYRRIIMQEACVYSEFRVHFSNMMYFMQAFGCLPQLMCRLCTVWKCFLTHAGSQLEMLVINLLLKILSVLAKNVDFHINSTF